MSILTASNPLILALVLSLYHVSKESYRILKLKKILICSTIGVFTLLLDPETFNLAFIYLCGVVKALGEFLADASQEELVGEELSDVAIVLDNSELDVPVET